MNHYDYDSLCKMIHSDLALSEQLLGLLQTESQSLAQHDYAALSSITEKKQPLIDELQNHASLRHQWLQSLYTIADQTNWLRLLESLESPEIDKSWQQFSQQIEKCKEINNKNGLLTNRGQRTCAQLLQLLKGGEKASELYTSKGNKRSTSIYTSVAKV